MANNNISDFGTKNSGKSKNKIGNNQIKDEGFDKSSNNNADGVHSIYN